MLLKGTVTLKTFTDLFVFECISIGDILSTQVNNTLPWFLAASVIV